MGWVEGLVGGHPAERRAVVDHDGTEMSHGELGREVAAAREMLARHGLGPGDRLLLVAENCAQFPVLLLAAAAMRAWFVPVNARLTATELAAISAHARPRLTLFTVAASGAAARHAAGLASLGTLARAPLPARIDPHAPAEPVSDDPAQQVALLVYTSGTTGRPKGVMLNHASVVYNAVASARMRGVRPDDLLLAVLPCTHIMALSTAMLPLLHGGGAVRMMPRFEPGAVLAALEEDVTMFPAVPQMHARILEAAAARGWSIRAPRLRQIGSGGAPLDPGWKARVEAAYGLTLNNGYGMTEAGPAVSSTLFGPPRRDGSVGYAYPGVAVVIHDPDADGVGEIRLRGPNVMLGYYRDPEATAAAITPEGFLCTGDLGRMDDDGALHVVGRAKELIIRSGFNVYPPEVETALLACPGVREAAVVGRAVSGNEEVVAFVTAAPGVDARALRAALRDRLAPYKQPQHLVIVEAMPLSAAGKIRKAALLEEFAERLPPPD